MVDEWTGGQSNFTAKSLVVAAVGLAALVAVGWGALYGWPEYQGKAAVRERLKDPESAIFERVKVNRKTGAMCGAVNAKNSFGGYVGFRAFVLDSSGTVTFREADDIDSPDPDRRLAALNKALEFRTLLDAQCPGID